MNGIVSFMVVATFDGSVNRQWRIVSEHDARQPFPGKFASDGIHP
jgi:hypothetical protein